MFEGKCANPFCPERAVEPTPGGGDVARLCVHHAARAAAIRVLRITGAAARDRRSRPL